MNINMDITSLDHQLTQNEQSQLAPLTQKQLAFLDIKNGILKWRTWMLLAYQDIKLRYRRSILGPFWLTLSMAVTVYSMGFLYAHLFRTDLKDYYPFLVAGMLTWAFISNVITELTDTFLTSEGLIKQVKLPYSLYIHRVVARNKIIFFHNMLVMIPIFILFSATAKINFYTLLLIPNLLLTYLIAVIYGLILALIGARYRDIAQIIKSLIQVIFFVTPVIWNPSILPESKQFLVLCNPFYSFIELIRAPMLGYAPTFFNYIISLSFIAIGAFICLKMFISYRPRIIYWL